MTDEELRRKARSFVKEFRPPTTLESTSKKVATILRLRGKKIETDDDNEREREKKKAVPTRSSTSPAAVAFAGMNGEHQKRELLTSRDNGQTETATLSVDTLRRRAQSFNRYRNCYLALSSAGIFA